MRTMTRRTLAAATDMRASERSHRVPHTGGGGDIVPVKVIHDGICTRQPATLQRWAGGVARRSEFCIPSVCTVCTVCTVQPTHIFEAVRTNTAAASVTEENHHKSRKMPSSRMLGRVALVRTDASEEPNASIITVTIIGELGTTLAVTSNRRKLRRNSNQILHHIPRLGCSRAYPRGYARISHINQNETRETLEP
jgi:hypothetical protein